MSFLLYPTPRRLQGYVKLVRMGDKLTFYYTDLISITFLIQLSLSVRPSVHLSVRLSAFPFRVLEGPYMNNCYILHEMVCGI